MPDFGNGSVFFEADASNTSGTSPSWSGSAAPSTLDDAGRALQGALTREWKWRNYTASAGGTANAKTLTYTVAPAAGNPNKQIIRNNKGRAPALAFPLAVASASATTIRTVPITSDYLTTIIARANGRSNALTKYASFIISGAFVNVGGTVSQVGSTASIMAVENDAAFNLSFAISGTNVLVQVTSANSNPHRWSCDVEIYNQV